MSDKLWESLKDQIKQAEKSFAQMFSLSSAVTTIVSQTKEAISELKEVDTLLTEISKTNHKLSKSDLEQLGEKSFSVASKYGKTAAEYLSSVREASQAGYENAEGIAELSIAAQVAGNMTADLANQYISATNKAYQLNGSVQELSEILDGANNITDHNTVSMTDLAEGMAVVSSQAANAGIAVDETTAALATLSAATELNGSEIASAFNGIIMSIRQISDAENGMDAESLMKYEDACEALNVSLRETKDGMTSLRDPMEVLKELSVEYNKLEVGDTKRTNLIDAFGDSNSGNALDALLTNWDMYEKMLQEYADGTGSMALEAEKTANSWEGALQRISNTWAETVGNVANSDVVITILNSFNGLLSVINKVTDALGSFGTIGLGAGIFAGIKNVGRNRMLFLTRICLS